MITIHTTKSVSAEIKANITEYVRSIPGRYADEDVAFELDDFDCVDGCDEILGAQLLSML